MITINDIQANLDNIKNQLVELSKQAGDSVKSFADTDGAIHQKIQADLDEMQNKIQTGFTGVVGDVKNTVNGWFKH